MNRIVFTTLTLGAVALAACRPPPEETEPGDPGGAGGGETTTSDCGAGGSTTTATECLLPETPADCSGEYVDPHFTFEPGEASGPSLGPLVGEAPWGVAAGRAEVSEGYVTALHLPFSFGSPPSVVRVAVWQEPQCGLPSIPGEDLPWVDPDPAGVDPMQDGRWRVVLPNYVNLEPMDGYTWVAVALTWFDVQVGTRVSAAAPGEPRFAWYGLADRDCDGEADDGLRWEDVRARTLPGALSADVDLAADLEMFDGVPN